MKREADMARGQFWQWEKKNEIEKKSIARL